MLHTTDFNAPLLLCLSRALSLFLSLSLSLSLFLALSLSPSLSLSPDSSRPDSGDDFQVTVKSTVYVVPSSLGGVIWGHGLLTGLEALKQANHKDRDKQGRRQTGWEREKKRKRMPDSASSSVNDSNRSGPQTLNLKP